MIKFSLVCQNGHEFESWFQNGAAFDMQVEHRLLECPICQTRQVTKAIMAPAVTSYARGEREASPPPPPPTAPAPVALLDERQRELRTMIGDLRKRIFEQGDNVGERFPEEARKIHDGEVPERPIYGEASLEDAKALIEEGIGVMPIPHLPEDFN
jgi:hypothetical protein